MLSLLAVARLTHQKPDTPQQMLQFLGELPYPSFVKVMLSLGLGLNFEDDFKLLGQAV